MDTITGIKVCLVLMIVIMALMPVALWLFFKFHYPKYEAQRKAKAAQKRELHPHPKRTGPIVMRVKVKNATSSEEL